MTDPKATDIHIEGFTDEENKEVNKQKDAIIELVAARKEGRLPTAFRPPQLRIAQFDAGTNAEMNEKFESMLRDKLSTAGPEALGPVAAAVIGSVAGSVASTIVSKKLDSREIELLEDFELEISDVGSIAD